MVEDLREAAAVRPQPLHADDRAFPAAARPALEQIEEAVEQLAVRVAEELVTHVAKLGGVAAQWLGGVGAAGRVLEPFRSVAAHFAEDPQVAAQPLALLGAGGIVLEQLVLA